MSHFDDVMEFLEEHDFRIVTGYGRDEEAVHFAGHTLRHLRELYEEQVAASSNSQRPEGAK